jgi:hypothetical protein
MNRYGSGLSLALLVSGLALLAIGYLVLTTWQLNQGGVGCGTPLDNPGWDTGVPCHGAINRRTAVGWSLTGWGIASLVGAVTLVVIWRTASRSGARE